MARIFTPLISDKVLPWFNLNFFPSIFYRWTCFIVRSVYYLNGAVRLEICFVVSCHAQFVESVVLL